MHSIVCFEKKIPRLFGSLPTLWHDSQTDVCNREYKMLTDMPLDILGNIYL
jgi:hypothetical protein